MANNPKPKALKLSLEQILAEADAARDGATSEAGSPEASPRQPAAPEGRAQKVTQATASLLPPEPEPLRPVSVQFFLEEADRDRLKLTALHKRSSLNAICHEAISAWLEAQGLPPLKWTAANVPSGRRPRG